MNYKNLHSAILWIKILGLIFIIYGAYIFCLGVLPQHPYAHIFLPTNIEHHKTVGSVLVVIGVLAIIYWYKMRNTYE